MVFRKEKEQLKYMTKYTTMQVFKTDKRGSLHQQKVEADHVRVV